MKKLFFLIGVISSFHTTAQFNKGDKVIGLNGTFSNVQSTELNLKNKSTYLNSLIQYGVFTKSNLEMGINAGYSRNSYTYNYKDSTRFSDISSLRVGYSGGVYIQRYFTLTDHLFFTIYASASYSRLSSDYENIATSYSVEESKRGNGVNIYLRPNFIFLPTERWGIRGSMGNISYDYSATQDSEDRNSNLTASIGGFWLGLMYYIR